MQKPTIYSIDNVYAKAGGYTQYYDVLECLGYKTTQVIFNNKPLMTRFNTNCKIVSKHRQIKSSSLSLPRLVYIYSNQGSENWRPGVYIDIFSSSPYKVRIKCEQPWSVSNNVFTEFPWDQLDEWTMIANWDSNGASVNIGGIDFVIPVTCNNSNSWYATQIAPIYQASGNSQSYFYFKKVYDGNDKLIMEFLPVKRKVDNALGVLETFSGLFQSGSNLSEP